MFGAEATGHLLTGVSQLQGTDDEELAEATPGSSPPAPSAGHRGLPGTFELLKGITEFCNLANVY